MAFFKDNITLGVIISRMQVPYLTASHINMIQTVQSRHPKMLILLGVAKEINKKNPFDFSFRKQMIQPFMREHDLIMPIKDNEVNADWVKNVDSLIDSCLMDEKAVLYGGRDSFIPYYFSDKGKFETQELLPEDNDSGTELRKIAETKVPSYSKETAEAIIFYLGKVL